MNILPTIVVALYNREIPSKRLLHSLAIADYPAGEQVRLVISIDNDNNKNQNIVELANNYSWSFGPKEVIYQPKGLGLRDHFNFCGDLTEKYGAVIFLEDDLYVSPFFYDYVIKAIDYYEGDSNIAGISLYNYTRIEAKVNPLPFSPVDDGYDTYFLQQASWGQIWTWEMWRPFKKWFKECGKPEIIESFPQVPNNVKRWPNSSWKKNYITYHCYPTKF